jgi:hypothetical protein
MKISMYNVTVPVFIKSLTNLSGIIEKAEKEATEKKFDMAHLLTDQLYPDQFNFTRQVQIACDAAKGLTYRLSDVEAPKLEDNEMSAGELRARIAKTIDYLKSIKPEQVEGTEDKQVPIYFAPGKFLTGFEAVTELYLANFFFHMVTAYAILRHNGINLGKGDYIGNLALKDIEEK